jgi:hypothetical protein
VSPAVRSSHPKCRCTVRRWPLWTTSS